MTAAPALVFAAEHGGPMSKAFVVAFTRVHGGKSEVLWYEGSHGARQDRRLGEVRLSVSGGARRKGDVAR